MLKNRIFANASWIILCKLGQSICSFIVTMLTARCLGPSNYGLITYAASLVTFIVPIAQLGLDSIQVQELVEFEDEEGKIIGTTLFLSFLSSIACFIGIVTFTSAVNANEKDTIIVCTLYSILLFFQGSSLMQYWFQARYLSKYSSMANLFAYFLICGYKVYLLLTGKSIYWFALSNALDYMISFVLLSLLYKKLGGKPLSISYNVAKRMFSKSKYYILVNIMVVIFGQTDRIMLKLMIDDATTGFYSAAITCSNLFSFVFYALIDSARPMIFEAHKISKEKFEKSITALYSGIIYLSLVVVLGIIIFAPLVIYIIYGSAYKEAITPLRIVIWYIPFSFIGSIRNIWILAEGHQKWLTPVNAGGALLNVVLNFLLIPLWEASGAAFASLMTQFFTNVVISYMVSDIRRSMVLLIKGINPKYICIIIKKMLRRERI